MREPRQHHYIPRFYLSGFADPDIFARNSREVLWVYERGKAIRRSSPEKEAKQRDYYAFAENGLKNVEVEIRLGEIEALAAPIISDLSQNPRAIADSDKQVLAVFIGTMQMRTPSGRYISSTQIGPHVRRLMKEAAPDSAKFRALIEENCRLPSADEPFSIEEVRCAILDGYGDKLAARQDIEMFSIVEVGKMMAEEFLNMSWQIFCSGDHESFLVSDDPVISHAIDQRTNKLQLRVGHTIPGVNIWFPLSRSVCLRMVKGEESGFGRWVPAGIRSVNKFMLMCAERWVYASEQSEKIKVLFDKKGGKFSTKSVEFHFEGFRH